MSTLLLTAACTLVQSTFLSPMLVLALHAQCPSISLAVSHQGAATQPRSPHGASRRRHAARGTVSRSAQLFPTQHPTVGRSKYPAVRCSKLASWATLWQAMRSRSRALSCVPRSLSSTMTGMLTQSFASLSLLQLVALAARWQRSMGRRLRGRWWRRQLLRFGGGARGFGTHGGRSRHPSFGLGGSAAARVGAIPSRDDSEPYEWRGRIRRIWCMRIRRRRLGSSFFRMCSVWLLPRRCVPVWRGGYFRG